MGRTRNHANFATGNNIFVDTTNNRVGVGTTVPSKTLHIYTADGDIRIGDISEGLTTGADAGIIFTGLGTVTSALFTEVDGTILSYGINCEQIIGFETGRVGGVFRLDTRTSGSYGDASCFVVKGRPIGSATEYNALVVGLNDGNTYLSPIRGSVLVGTSSSTGTASQRLQVTGGGYFSGSVGIGSTNPGANLHIASNAPTILFTENDAAANNRNWLLTANAQEFYLQAQTDAPAGGGNIFKFTRSAEQIQTFEGLNSGVSWFTINNNTQRVGIGITNPISILETQENTTSTTDLTITNSNTGNNITKSSRIRFRLTDSVGTRKDVAYITAYTYNLDSSAGNYLSFFTRTVDATPTEKMRLDNNGNLVLGSSFTATGTASQPLQVTGGAYVSGNVGIGTTNPTSKLDVIGNSNFIGVVTATSLIPAETRFISVAEKLTRVNGNTVSLVYNASGTNIGLATNPTGNITLAVTGIPTTSDFDNHVLTFSIFVNQTGTARSCTAVTLNGVSRTIKWFGGSLASAISGVTTSSGYDIYSFTGINTIGSASTAANYDVLGVVNGGFR